MKKKMFSFIDKCFCFLGFDPCNLFMSALASDIEDEQRPLPSQTSLSYRPTLNSYGYSSNTNNSSWMPQQYHQYHEKQQRYPPSFSNYSLCDKQNQIKI